MRLLWVQVLLTLVATTCCMAFLPSSLRPLRVPIKESPRTRLKLLRGGFAFGGFGGGSGSSGSSFSGFGSQASGGTTTTTTSTNPFAASSNQGGFGQSSTGGGGIFGQQGQQQQQTHQPSLFQFQSGSSNTGFSGGSTSSFGGFGQQPQLGSRAVSEEQQQQAVGLAAARFSTPKMPSQSRRRRCTMSLSRIVRGVLISILLPTAYPSNTGGFGGFGGAAAPTPIGGGLFSGASNSMFGTTSANQMGGGGTARQPWQVTLQPESAKDGSQYNAQYMTISEMPTYQTKDMARAQVTRDGPGGLLSQVLRRLQNRIYPSSSAARDNEGGMSYDELVKKLRAPADANQTSCNDGAGAGAAPQWVMPGGRDSDDVAASYRPSAAAADPNYFIQPDLHRKLEISRASGGAAVARTPRLLSKSSQFHRGSTREFGKGDLPRPHGCAWNRCHPMSCNSRGALWRFMRARTPLPPVGRGLNKPALVTLYGVFPEREENGGRRESTSEYIRTLRRLTEEQGAIFLGYEPKDGLWKMKVPHF
eukprot:jgi/Bigna1/81624/fgenesh1_pg.82_\